MYVIRVGVHVLEMNANLNRRDGLNNSGIDGMILLNRAVRVQDKRVRTGLS
jgi:hypothetical protein